MYAKFRCAPLRTMKALGIFRELITTTTTTTTTITTRVAFWDPPSGSKNYDNRLTYVKVMREDKVGFSASEAQCSFGRPVRITGLLIGFSMMLVCCLSWFFYA